MKFVIWTDKIGKSIHELPPNFPSAKLPLEQYCLVIQTMTPVVTHTTAGNHGNHNWYRYYITSGLQLIKHFM